MEFLVKKSEKVLFAIKIIATIGIMVGIICSIPKLSGIDAGMVSIITPIIIYVVIIFAYFWF